METNTIRLFIIDISGYTRFLVNTDLVHGKETITDILNKLYDFSPKELSLNKVEGDALFFYSTTLSIERLCQISRDIYNYFKHEVLTSVSHKHNTCPFTLCRHINDLSIKFFIHEGEVAFHKVCNFDEMIGKAVIEIHRVMKNSVNSDSYILTIDQNGKYYEKYKYIGKVNYNILYLDKKKNIFNKLSYFFN